jgi:hypothetical protein
MHLHPRRWRYGYAWITLGFFVFSLVGHWLFAWFAYTSEQIAHNQPIQVSSYLIQTLRDTLENWQSEFLQLFTFVALAALLIHKGSAESKDGEEKLEASLRRIEQHLGTLPSSAPDEPGEEWKLPETPLESVDKIRGSARR